MSSVEKAPQGSAGPKVVTLGLSILVVAGIGVFAFLYPGWPTFTWGIALGLVLPLLCAVGVVLRSPRRVVAAQETWLRALQVTSLFVGLGGALGGSAAVARAVLAALTFVGQGTTGAPALALALGGAVRLLPAVLFALLAGVVASSVIHLLRASHGAERVDQGDRPHGPLWEDTERRIAGLLSEPSRQIGDLGDEVRGRLQTLDNAVEKLGPRTDATAQKAIDALAPLREEIGVQRAEAAAAAHLVLEHLLRLAAPPETGIERREEEQGSLLGAETAQRLEMALDRALDQALERSRASLDALGTQVQAATRTGTQAISDACTQTVRIFTGVGKQLDGTAAHVHEVLAAARASAEELRRIRTSLEGVLAKIGGLQLEKQEGQEQLQALSDNLEAAHKEVLAQGKALEKLLLLARAEQTTLSAALDRVRKGVEKLDSPGRRF